MSHPSKDICLSQVILHPEDVWQCLETFGVVTMRGARGAIDIKWVKAKGATVPHRAQDSPHPK